MPFVRTFLYGLLLVLKALRAYFNRNEDGIKEHLSADVFDLLVEVIANVSLIIEAILGSPLAVSSLKMQSSDERYKIALVKLRERRVQYTQFQASYPPVWNKGDTLDGS